MLPFVTTMQLLYAINHDSFLDLATVNAGNQNIGISLGYGNFSFATEMLYPTGNGSSPSFITTGHFNDDTHLDIAVANYNSHTVGIFLGYGNGSLSKQTTYSTGYHPCSIAVADFDNDSMLDIIVANYDSNNLLILRGRNDSTFQNMLLIQLEYGTDLFSVRVGDFNNDKKMDFIVANNGTDSLQLFLQTC